MSFVIPAHRGIDFKPRDSSNGTGNFDLGVYWPNLVILNNVKFDKCFFNEERAIQIKILNRDSFSLRVRYPNTDSSEDELMYFFFHSKGVTEFLCYKDLCITIEWGFRGEPWAFTTFPVLPPAEWESFNIPLTEQIEKKVGYFQNTSMEIHEYKIYHS
ncbi:unnamed protein product [Caenorhabditis sp. 36 PRJEB53466]|nr:unnamed protein product [Caenorhabditis sp. 36 PRJEB53466]